MRSKQWFNRFSTATVAVAFASFGMVAGVQADASFSYADFGSVADFTLSGNAAQSGTALRVVPDVGGQVGGAFLTSPVTFADDYSFNTQFQIEISGGAGIDCCNDPLGADGMVFVLHQDERGPSALGDGGGFIGIAADDPSSAITPMLAIEFDTWHAGAFDAGANANHNGDHIAIDVAGTNLNGNPYSSYSIAQTGPGVTGGLNDGTPRNVWVDYDGVTKRMNIFMNEDAAKPVVPILSQTLYLDQIFNGTDINAGFTAATGGAQNNYDVNSWSFDSAASTSAAPAPPATVNVGFDTFADDGEWQLNGDAAEFNGRLQLNPDANSQVGSAFLAEPVVFSSDYNFDAKFSFEIKDPSGVDFAGDPAGADGMAFVIQANGAQAIGGAGGTISLDVSPMVAVELDTWHTGAFDDPANGGVNGKHLAIDVSSEQYSIAQYPEVGQPSLSPTFNDGGEHFVWVEYDGEAMSVYFATEDVKPAAPVMSADVDMNALFGTATDLYVGFTGATGGANESHDVLSFSLSNGPAVPFVLNGGGQTYEQNFDEMALGTKLPRGWSGETDNGTTRRAAGLGLTDGFLTVPGNDADGVLGVLNVGGNADSFGPAPDGFVPTWSAELGGDANLFGRDDVIADGATDRALGVSRVNNDNVGELNFEIEIADSDLRAFVLDWDLEIWGGDPDGAFRSADGAGMMVDVTVGGNSYGVMTENLLPGDSFDSIEDGNNAHNATLIDGNVHSIRGMTTGIKEITGADGAVGNMVQINFNSNWNGANNDDANGWISAIDNVRLRALAPGDADANGVVDVTDLLVLLGGQKFNAGVDSVTWEQGDFNGDDQFDTGDLLSMLAFLSGTFPSDPYASEAGEASDAVADVIVNSETGEVTVDLAGHTVSAIIIESASEIFNGSQPAWDTTSQFPSTLPGELGNVLFTSTAAGVDELGAVISAEFLGRDKEFYLQDLDLNILIASEGGALTKGNVIVVPEPSTWLMLGLGSLLLVGWRQAKRKLK